MSRPSLQCPVKAGLFLLLATPMACSTPSTGSSGGASGAVLDSGTEAGDAAQASATIGPEGGRLELEDGTAFVVPVGALSEDVELVLTEVDEVETPFDDMDELFRARAPFTISPEVTGRVPFEVHLPAALASDGAESLRLVATGSGLWDVHADAATTAPEEGLVHPLWLPSESGDDAAVFAFHSTANVVLQPFGTIPEGRTAGYVTANTQLNEPCSQVVWQINQTPVPPDLDQVVQVSTPILDDLKNSYGRHQYTSQAQAEDMVTAFNRFHARVCMSTYRAITYMRDERGMLPLTVDLADPTSALHFVPVTVQWEHVDCKTNGRLAESNGNGLTVYFSADCENTAWKGWSDSFNSESPTGDYSQHVDELEATIAHELVHYVQDWANLKPNDLRSLPSSPMGTWGFAEGYAEQMMDEVFDDNDGAAWMPVLWSSTDTHTVPLSKSPSKRPYGYNGFFRWIDWHQDSWSERGQVGTLALQAVRDETLEQGCLAAPCSGRPMEEWSHVEDALATVFSSRDADEHTFEVLYADYAASMLFLHDFERVSTENPTGDRFVDAVGIQADEVTGDRDLWKRLPTGGDTTDISWDRATPMDPGLAVLEVDELPDQWNALVDEGRGRVFALRLDPAVFEDGPVVRAEIAATTDAGDTGDIALRLYSVDSDGVSTTLHKSLDAISPHADAPSTFVIAPDWLDLGTLFLVVVNHGDEDAEVSIELDEVDELGMSLSSSADTITGLSLDSPGYENVCTNGDDGPDLGPTFRSDVTRVYEPVDGYAVSYPYTDEIRYFARNSCDQEAETTFDSSGPGPISTTLSPGLTELVVGRADPTDPCAEGAVTLVELASGVELGTVSLPAGVGEVEVVVKEGMEIALLTTPGDYSCRSSTVYLVPLDTLREADGATLTWQEAAETLSVGGQDVGYPRHLSVSRSRDFAVWSTGEQTGTLVVWDVEQDWIEAVVPDDEGVGYIGGVAIAEPEGSWDVRVYFTVQFLYDDGDIDRPAGCETGITCGALRWFDYQADLDNGDTSHTGAGVRVLTERYPGPLGLFEDGGFVVVGHLGSTVLSVLDVGDHTGGTIPVDEAVPSLTSGDNPSVLVAPR